MGDAKRRLFGEVSERILRGLSDYAAGNMSAACRGFDEALRLLPDLAHREHRVQLHIESLAPPLHSPGLADDSDAEELSTGEAPNPMIRPVGPGPLRKRSEERTEATETFVRKNTMRPMPRLSDDQGSEGRTDTQQEMSLSAIPDVAEALLRGDKSLALTLADRYLDSLGGMYSDGNHRQIWLLEQVYLSVIGALDRIPQVAGVSADLDARCAFVLSRIDGVMRVADLIEVSGMPRLEALQVLAKLVENGCITSR